MKPNRILFTLPNGRGIRFQAHTTNPELVVAKSDDPEAIDSLIIETGIDPGVQSAWIGTHYKITALQRDGAAKLIAAAFAKLANADEPAPAAPVGEGDAQLAEYDADTPADD